MEDQRSEIEFDEFEKLLGEIPNATSGNSHLEETGPRLASLNGTGSLTEKLHRNGSLDDKVLLVKNTQGSPARRVKQEQEVLPDDQLLTSTFAELNLTDASSLANYNSSRACAILLDCLYTNCAKNSLSNTNTPVMFTRTFQSGEPHSFNEFNMKKVGHGKTNLFKSDNLELKQRSIGYCQPQLVESFSRPIAHGSKSFQYLPNLAVPGVEYPWMSNQQHYFPDLQPAVPYIHSQQMSQPRIWWSNIEEEQYHSMQQHFLYLQQLHDQGCEDQHHIQTTGTVATKMMSQTVRQSSFELPLCHQSQQSNPEPYWSNCAATRGLNSTLHAIHIVDKVGKHTSPDKILTRSQGLNTFKPAKFGPTGQDESFVPLNQNEKVVSDHCLQLNLPSSSAGCFQLDHLSSFNVSPEITLHKNDSSWPQPQKYNTVDEITGRIYLMAKDQHGCRFLQRKFSEGSTEDIEKIFLEIIGHMVELMTDPFGNYLVQKLLEVCDEDQRIQLLCTITRTPGELIRISCDMHGTRAVQKVIETVKTAEQFLIIVSSLKPGMVTLIKNMNGNHVAQRCLQYLMPEYREFLFEATITNCVELATDRHGCCVLQKCLSHFDGEQRHRLICEITSSALILSQDPFGKILDQLEGNYVDLSMQKYSSNVVEKCLKYGGDKSHALIIRELINNSRLDHVMQDPYGNYVVQAALQWSKGAPHEALVDAIKPLAPVLQTSPYGKKVLSSNSLKK
ncbi:hypothetical protein K2173_014508 [Erythroxylum novogranatense]|uniref:PUM-HD domain-containing protein n=1 Tax=Erythroxylum novogranatense TaxID=1862640 RepID=A0AAV8S6E8_9ROSI|nr:hypothetical protein K2173_014508 [Erythroxylum novogranatense]